MPTHPTFFAALGVLVALMQMPQDAASFIQNVKNPFASGVAPLACGSGHDRVPRRPEYHPFSAGCPGRAVHTRISISNVDGDALGSLGRVVPDANPGTDGDVIVRPATASDVESIAAVSMDCFYGRRALPGLGGGLLDLLQRFENPEGKPYLGLEYKMQRDRLVSRLVEETESASAQFTGDKRAAVFAAEEITTGKVVGAVELIMVPYPALPKPAVPYLFNLCVEARHRSRGLGRQLVATCEKEAVEWGFKQLFLHVERSPIKEIYDKYGYSATYQQPSWVQLNVQNKLVLPYDPENSVEGGWIMMHKWLIVDAA